MSLRDHIASDNRTRSGSQLRISNNHLGAKLPQILKMSMKLYLQGLDQLHFFKKCPLFANRRVYLVVWPNFSQ